MASSMPAHSPYAYTFNDPINFTDPTGKSGEPVFDKETNTLTRYSDIVIYGNGALQELATKMAGDIQSMWNAAAANIGGYNVKFEITGSYDGAISQSEIEGNTDIRKNFFHVVDGGGDLGISYVDGLGSNTGQFLLSNVSGENSTTAAHEYGHSLGIIPGQQGGHSAPDQRGQGVPDIMAARGTLVDSKFQYDPSASPGAPGGTVDPTTRQVSTLNVSDVISQIKFNRSGATTWRSGKLTNQYHD